MAGDHSDMYSLEPFRFTDCFSAIAKSSFQPDYFNREKTAFLSVLPNAPLSEGNAVVNGCPEMLLSYLMVLRTMPVASHWPGALQLDECGPWKKSSSKTSSAWTLGER